MHIRHFLLPLLAAAIFSSCASQKPSVATVGEDAVVERALASMSLEERVGQLFFLRPEALVDTITDEHIRDVYHHFVTALDTPMTALDREFPAGGFCFFAHNIVDPEQIVRFTEAVHALPGAPLICVDEEGGRVARIGNNRKFGLNRFPPMGELAETGLPQNARFAGTYMGAYLHYYGFDIDMGPVADVNTNPDNIVIGSRAFSHDPAEAAVWVSEYVGGLRHEGVAACLKHFPGHGDTKGDSHSGLPYTNKTWEEMSACEMVSFRAGIEAGAELIMTAHIAAPQVTGSDLPATLSQVILTDKLRKEMGYEGVIMSDALEMAAIRQLYEPGEACVLTILAGTDIIMLPLSYRASYKAVVDAVRQGRITEQRIDESVRRILRLKYRLGRLK